MVRGACLTERPPARHPPSCYQGARVPKQPRGPGRSSSGAGPAHPRCHHRLTAAHAPHRPGRQPGAAAGRLPGGGAAQQWSCQLFCRAVWAGAALQRQPLLCRLGLRLQQHADDGVAPAGSAAGGTVQDARAAAPPRHARLLQQAWERASRPIACWPPQRPACPTLLLPGLACLPACRRRERCCLVGLAGCQTFLRCKPGWVGKAGRIDGRAVEGI